MMIRCTSRSQKTPATPYRMTRVLLPLHVREPRSRSHDTVATRHPYTDPSLIWLLAHRWNEHITTMAPNVWRVKHLVQWTGVSRSWSIYVQYRRPPPARTRSTLGFRAR